MPNRTASIAFAQNVSLQFEDMSSFAHINLWLGEFFEKVCSNAYPAGPHAWATPNCTPLFPFW